MAPSNASYIGRVVTSTLVWLVHGQIGKKASPGLMTTHGKSYYMWKRHLHGSEVWICCRLDALRGSGQVTLLEDAPHGGLESSHGSGTAHEVPASGKDETSKIRTAQYPREDHIYPAKLRHLHHNVLHKPYYDAINELVSS